MNFWLSCMMKASKVLMDARYNGHIYGINAVFDFNTGFSMISSYLKERIQS